MHFTEYSKVLNFFKSQVVHNPNTDLANIMAEFLKIKHSPDDIGAARYLISQFPIYSGLLSTANAHVSK